MLILRADHEPATSYVYCDLDPAHTSVIPRSGSPSTDSFISDFTPQWPFFAQGTTAVPTYHRQPVTAKEEPPVEGPKRTSSSFSATRKLFARLWTKRVARSNTGASVANRNQSSESARSQTNLSPNTGPTFTDISLR